MKQVLKAPRLEVGLGDRSSACSMRVGYLSPQGQQSRLQHDPVLPRHEEGQ